MRIIQLHTHGYHNKQYLIWPWPSFHRPLNIDTFFSKIWVAINVWVKFARGGGHPIFKNRLVCHAYYSIETLTNCTQDFFNYYYLIITVITYILLTFFFSQGIFVHVHCGKNMYKIFRLSLKNSTWWGWKYFEEVVEDEKAHSAVAQAQKQFSRCSFVIHSALPMRQIGARHREVCFWNCVTARGRLLSLV